MRDERNLRCTIYDLRLRVAHTLLKMGERRGEK
jgi:hypothetical protein